MTYRSGISNREDADAEQKERDANPSRTPDAAPAPQDAAGRSGDEGPVDDQNEQTSHKGGSRSTAQKAGGTRYAEGSMPATRKVPGAFGSEPRDGRDEPPTKE
jgi:hypothetical protein